MYLNGNGAVIGQYLERASHEFHQERNDTYEHQTNMVEFKWCLRLKILKPPTTSKKQKFKSNKIIKKEKCYQRKFRSTNIYHNVIDYI